MLIVLLYEKASVIFKRLIDLFNELQNNKNIKVDVQELEQSIIEFRLQNNLAAQEDFQQWLSNENLSYEDFQKRLVLGYKLEKLKSHVTQGKVEDYFDHRKSELEQVELECLLFREKDLALRTREKIESGQITLEECVEEYSTSKNISVQVLKGIVRRAKIFPELKSRLATSQIGQLSDLIEIQKQWCLFCIHRVIPPVLDENLNKELKDLLFQEWLAKKMQSHPIKFAFDLEK